MRRVFSFLLLLTFTLWLAGCGAGTHSTPMTPTGAGTGTGGNGGSGGGTGGGGSMNGFVSYVYTAGSSNINGYGVSANGTLTAVTGSPYGNSTIGQIATNGADLYVINGDFVTLTTFGLDKSTGALTKGASQNSIIGNQNPQDQASTLALDHTGGDLYIGEMDGSGDDGFNIFSLSNPAAPMQIQWEGGSGQESFGPPLVFSPDNQFAYNGNCYHLGWTIFEYQRAANGTLTLNNINGGGASGPAVLDQNFPCPEAFAVSAQGFLAVAYNDETGNGTTMPVMLTTYKINADGSLTAVANSKVTTASSLNPNNSANPQVGIAFDPTGMLLAVAGSGGVQTFSMNAGGTLAPAAAATGGTVQFQNVTWDKSNHIFATGNGQLYVFNSTNGTLTQASGSPYAGGVGVVALPLQ